MYGEMEPDDVDEGLSVQDVLYIGSARIDNVGSDGVSVEEPNGCGCARRGDDCLCGGKRGSGMRRTSLMGMSWTEWVCGEVDWEARRPTVVVGSLPFFFCSF